MEEEDKIAIEKMIEDLAMMQEKFANAAITHLTNALTVENTINETLVRSAMIAELRAREMTDAKSHLEMGLRRYLKEKQKIDAKAKILEKKKVQDPLNRQRMQEALKEARQYIESDQAKTALQAVLKMMMEKKKEQEKSE